MSGYTPPAPTSEQRERDHWSTIHRIMQRHFLVSAERHPPANDNDAR